MVNKKRESNFGSKIGAVLAAAGSAVGLGNVWRFPTETGNNGGAAFILIYVLFMLILGVPMMINELAIGRHGQKDVGHAFYKMSGGKKIWRWMGLLPLISGVLILSYYSVVAGWTLEYALEAGADGFSGKTSDVFISEFNAFSSHPLYPLGWIASTLGLTAIVVALGVQRGIERAAKVMMPLLFFCILVLVVLSMSLPGAGKGLEFLFRPDFSKVTGGVALAALGQAFFSLSVGICCLCTYACYFRKDVDLVGNALQVAGIDTMVAILSGMIIFPAVYSIPGLQPDAGPSLVFITLPNVFQQVFAGSHALSYIFSLMFYLLLVMAALTSSISMLEMVVNFFSEEMGWKRPSVCIVVSLTCLILGAGCSWSFGIWNDFTLFGMGLFDLFDFVVAKLFMPLGALIMCIFTGWVVDERVLRAEITNNGTLRQPLYRVYLLLTRWVAPLLIILIFINEL